MWHVLHGPNTVARDEEVAKMRARVGDDAMADVNVIEFGPDAALADIQNAAETMPFFLEKKLVLVRSIATSMLQISGGMFRSFAGLRFCTALSSS